MKRIVIIEAGEVSSQPISIIQDSDIVLLGTHAGPEPGQAYYCIAKNRWGDIGSHFVKAHKITDFLDSIGTRESMT